MNAYRPLLLGALALSVACRSTEVTLGVDDAPSPPSVADAPDSPGPDAAPPVVVENPPSAVERDEDVGSEDFDIRVLGVNRADTNALLLSVAELRATADGRPVKVTMKAPRMNLAAADHAWLVGRISVPRNAKHVELALRWGDFGGYETLAGGGAVDARGPDVTWSAPTEWFRLHGHAVLNLDVAASLGTEGTGARRFLPVHSVQY